MSFDLNDADFAASARVLLVGGRNSGKSSALATVATSRKDSVLVAGAATAQITALTTTVAEEIALGLEIDVSSRDELVSIVSGIAERLGISHLLDRDPLSLSGGQTQLVVLAAHFVLGAPVLLLDEPLIGLDASARERVLSAIAGYRGAVLWSSTRAWQDERAVASRVVEKAEELGEKVSAELDLGLEPATVTASELAISAQKPTKRFKSAVTPVVSNLNFTVAPGDIICLTGANGAGKTTLLKTIAGLLEPVSGKLRVGEVAPARLLAPQRVKRASLAAQNPAHHFLTSSVAKEFRVGGAATCTETERDHLLELVGLARKLETHPHDLSPVEQHLLAVATAAATGASCLLLDEPTGRVDQRGVQQIADLVHAYAAAGGSVIVATHDREFMKLLDGRELTL